jgi:aspartyl-tRNA(Asn)/glutamyl-tRNA(Gln) amidotransferase subunit B
MNDIKIGLEIHMHLNTKEKLFCECLIPKKDGTPNSLICPVCTGQPGSKPMLPNIEAIKGILKLGLVFKSKITMSTFFQRKHYTWPDMPTGFQRTCSGGTLKPNLIGGEFLGIGIEEVHIEENPAGWNPKSGEINYNRSGFPLAEIVTKPEFKTVEELEKWLQELILVGKYLGVLNEEFGIKSDVNVSIKQSGFTRVEIKNVNSYTNIVASAKTEIERQKDLVRRGEKVKQETRRYNEELDTTQFMRSKENTADYRFTPEPDLPNLEIEENQVEELKKQIPKMPWEKREDYKKYGFDEEIIEVLVSNLYLTTIFEHAIEKKLNPKQVGLFLKREILRVLNYNKHDFKDLEDKQIKDEIIVLIALLGSDKISYTTAQKTLEKLYDGKIKNVAKYITDNKLSQVTDNNLIEDLIKKALKDSPKAVEDFKSGNNKALNSIVGIVMRQTKGTAKPQVVNELLKKLVK